MAIRMSKKTWIIVAIVIIAVGAIVGIALSCNSSTPSDIALPIITWNETTLSTLEGTPVVLVFWTTGCPYCNQQLHYLEAVAQQTEGDIKVIAINVGQSTSAVQKFFGDYEPTMIIALDKNGKAFVDYCLAYNNPGGSIPFTLFVDSEGMVKYWQVGAFASETALWDKLSSVLGITAP
jgi:thiol-disulfide isomerase/thioredoxin